MDHAVDQHAEYRAFHRGGAVYLLVEAALWLAAASVGYLGHESTAVVLLVFGGMFIHLVASGISRRLKFPEPSEGNRLAVLNTFVALTIPLGLPLIYMACGDGRLNLFFPAFSILVGAHWLPFVYIYRMWTFSLLAGIMVALGIFFGFINTASFSAAGFAASAALLVFGLLHLRLVQREVL